MQGPMPWPTLTPSEVVFLAANRFAAPAGRGIHSQIAGIQIDVTVRELAQQAYAAAFLALAGAGALRLQVRAMKTLLALRTVEALFADPAGSPPAFPAASLESHLYQQALALSRQNRQDVTSVTAELWKLGNALGQIIAYLAARELLTTTTTTHLKIIKTAKHAIPERTAAAAKAKAGGTQQWLQACRSAQPELWKRLVDAITEGILKRKDDSSYGGNDF